MDKQTKHNSEIIAQFTQQATPFTKIAGHFDAIEKLVEISKTTKNDKVLDVASGPGLVAAGFAKAAQHVECFDLTPAMLQQAKKYLIAEGVTNVSFQKGDAMHLPYPDNSFDIVVTRYSFHHFLYPASVLKEIIRVCKKKGHILIADIMMEKEASETFDHIEKLRDSSHVKALTQMEFTNLFTYYNFDNVSQYRYTVGINLEELLSASSTKEINANEIRRLITSDVGSNKTGYSPNIEQNQIYCSYPISIFSFYKTA